MNLFIDTTNLYYNAKKRYSGIIDYEALLAQYNDTRIDLIHVYIARMSIKSDGFISYMESVLRLHNHVIRIKEPFPVKINGQTINMTNFNVELTVDALSVVGRRTIFSSDYNLLPLIEEVNPTVHAINIPHVFKEYSHTVEITEEYILGTTPTT